MNMNTIGTVGANTMTRTTSIERTFFHSTGCKQSVNETLLGLTLPINTRHSLHISCWVEVGVKHDETVG